MFIEPLTLSESISSMGERSWMSVEMSVECPTVLHECVENKTLTKLYNMETRDKIKDYQTLSRATKVRET